MCGQVDELGATRSSIFAVYGPPCLEDDLNLWYCPSEDRIGFGFKNGVVSVVTLMYAQTSSYAAQQALDSRLRQLRSSFGKEDRYNSNMNTYSWYFDDSSWGISTFKINGIEYNTQTVTSEVLTKDEWDK